MSEFEDRKLWPEIDGEVFTIEEAIEKFGLNWEVRSKPAYFMNSAQNSWNGDEIPLEEVDTWDPDDLHADYRRVPNYFVNVRSDNLLPLGVVTKRYAPFHNIQAFGFLSHIFKSDMDFISAGDFMNSRRVWVLMKLPGHIQIGDDQVGQYAFVHTSHDGKHSVTAAMTPYLIRSSTLLTSEVRRARNFSAGRVLSLRHLGDMEQKISELEAERVLDFTVNYYREFKRLGDLLVEENPSADQADDYLEALLPVDDDMKDRQAANRIEARAEIQGIFHRIGWSWWSLYTAAVEYADWLRNERKSGGRMQRAIDDPDGFKARAWDLALAGAEL